MYDPKSMKAEEFIDHQEIEETLAYTDAQKADRELITSIIEKAKLRKGLSHRDASVLLACELEDLNQEVYALAKQIKQDFYGNRIVMFAPLYLSNYCVNGCLYCPYHLKNKHITRKKLTQEEIKAEVIALQDMGHKRLALELGEDPVRNPIEYVLESVKTIYSIKHKNGEIRRVNVNIAATTVENYRKLKEAGIGTYILFQETYHKESYEQLHPTGPKSDYAYHTEAHDRAMQGGTIDGVTFDAGKAGTDIKSGEYENISSGMNANRHGAVGSTIQNCTFTGTCPNSPYNCIRFYEQKSSGTHAMDVTIQNCKFLCNAQQYVRLYYVHGYVKVLNNTFGGDSFGSSHNNLNGSATQANWTITGNSFNNWNGGGAFGSSKGDGNVLFTITDNTFNNTSGTVIWLKNHSDATHEGILIKNNTYTGGLTQTDADAILRV